MSIDPDTLRMVDRLLITVGGIVSIFLVPSVLHH
jgi:hypothetical protein